MIPRKEVMAIGDYLRINTNIGAFNALNALKSVNNRMAAAQLRLATGKRITVPCF